jgi:hypothetical protein
MLKQGRRAKTGAHDVKVAIRSSVVLMYYKYMLLFLTQLNKETD